MGIREAVTFAKKRYSSLSQTSTTASTWCARMVEHVLMASATSRVSVTVARSDVSVSRGDRHASPATRLKVSSLSHPCH